MEDARSKALKERAELLKRLEQIDTFLTLHDEFSKGQQSAVGPSSRGAGSSAESTPTSDGWLKHGRMLNGLREERTTPAEMIQATIKVLRKAGRPMARRQLLEAIERQGIKISGKDPLKVLGTNLWRSDEIVALDGYGYWLRDTPSAIAGYEPEYPGSTFVDEAKIRAGVPHARLARGDNYRQRGWVDLIHAGADGVIAHVTGETGNVYVVDIKNPDGSDAVCSCPDFVDTRTVCKHIIATARQLALIEPGALREANMRLPRLRDQLDMEGVDDPDAEVDRARRDPALLKALEGG